MSQCHSTQERLCIEAEAMLIVHGHAPEHVPTVHLYDADNSVMAMQFLPPPHTKVGPVASTHVRTCTHAHTHTRARARTHACTRWGELVSNSHGDAEQPVLMCVNIINVEHLCGHSL